MKRMLVCCGKRVVSLLLPLLLISILYSLYLYWKAQFLIREPIQPKRLAAIFKDREPIWIRFLKHPTPVVNRCRELRESENQSEPEFVLLVLVNSSPYQPDLRQAIRNSWKNASTNAEVVFLVGQNSSADGKDFDYESRGKLCAEIDRYQDIILTDIEEHFYHLPLKTYAMMKWASEYCENVPCVMKTDTDSILFVDNIVNLCKEEKPRIVGCCWNNSVVVRNPKLPKLYVPLEVYPNRTYPRYCSGSGVLIVGPGTPRKLFSQSPKRPWKVGWLRNVPEDVMFSGIFAELAGIERKSKPGFTYKRVTSYNPCHVGTRMLTHNFKNPNDVVRYWNVFQQDKHLPCVTTEPRRKQRLRNRRRLSTG